MTIVRNAMLLAALAAAQLAAPAQARKEIAPYLEVGQVLTADLKNGGDVLTYSTIAAGIDASVSNARAEAQVSYRYERRFAWDDDVADDDVHSGLARARFTVADGASIEGGAIAARARSDIRGDAPTILVGNIDNVTQVYSAYVGPTLETQVGDLDFQASYRLGYTKVEDDETITLPAGQQRLDGFDDAVTHAALASVGMAPGRLPFGWTVSSTYERADAGQLDQRFEAATARADVIVPVSPNVAVVGGVGYENIEASQRDPLRDAGGAPVIDGSGRFVTDPASPRRLAYDQDGFIWDVGVSWRPSRRTSVEARVGERYGSMTYIGSATWAPSENTVFAVSLYDDVSTFGSLLNDNLARLPTSFQVQRNNFANLFGGCVFGAGGAAGGCLDDVFQSVTTSTFRSRGIAGIYSSSRGPWSWGAGVGYNRRSFKAPRTGGFFTIDGVRDESFLAQAYVERQLTPNSGVDANVYANYFNSGLIGAPDVLATGATASYFHTFGRLSALVSAGLYSFAQDGSEGELTAAGQVAVRYGF